MAAPHMTRKTIHKHHIIPKHVGGTDDPTNIQYLSIKEHADAHRLLFEQYGRWQDRVAWLGLSGAISREEATFMAQSENGKETIKRLHKRMRDRGLYFLRPKPSIETRNRMSRSHIGKKIPKDAEYRRKISETLSGRSLSKEHKKSISNGLRGRVQTEETKQKIRETKAKNPPSVEARKKMGRRLGIPHTEESKAKMRGPRRPRSQRRDKCPSA